MRKLRQEKVKDLPICTVSNMMGPGFEPGRIGLLPPPLELAAALGL